MNRFQILDRVGEFFNVRPNHVTQLLSIQWGWDKRPGNIRLCLFGRCVLGTDRGMHTHDGSLYYNGMFFARVMFAFPSYFQAALIALHGFIGLGWWSYLLIPAFFFCGVMLRWSDDPARRWQFLQAHFGNKLNGEFAVTCRLQNDASARESDRSPAYDNVGQAVGFADGPH